MKKTIKICDLCNEDGEEEVTATASYIADDDLEYDVCNKHLKDVKSAKLDWWLIK